MINISVIETIIQHKTFVKLKMGEWVRDFCRPTRTTQSTDIKTQYRPVCAKLFLTGHPPNITELSDFPNPVASMKVFQ